MLRELRLQYVYKPSAFVFSLSVFTYLLQVPGEFRILAQNFKSIQNVPFREKALWSRLSGSGTMTSK